MEKLPNEIFNHIIFDYMYLNDIASCLIASNLFHVLTDNQIRIYRDALMGPKYLLKKNLFESLDFIPTEYWHKLKFRWYFSKCCRKGHLESVQWLHKFNQIHHKFDFEKEYYSDGCDSSEEHSIFDSDEPYISQTNYITNIFVTCCMNDSLNTARWLYSLNLKHKINFGPNVTKYLLEYVSEHCSLSMAQLLYSIYIDNSVNVNYQKIFSFCCFDKTLETAKWIYSLEESKNKIDINEDQNFLFEQTCMFNQIKTVKYLYSINGAIDFHFNNEVIFRVSCTSGNLEVIQWLWFTSLENGNKIDIHVNKDEAFCRACSSGSLELVKFLLSLDGKINVHTQRKRGFKHCCTRGSPEIFQYLYSIAPFDIHEKNESLFRIACKFGQIEMVKLLLSMDPGSLNIHIHNDYPFRIACLNNYLKLAKFLFDNAGEKINIRMHNDILFRTVYHQHYTEMTKWLASICPNYVIIYDNPGDTILNVTIDDKKLNTK